MGPYFKEKFPCHSDLGEALVVTASSPVEPVWGSQYSWFRSLPGFSAGAGSFFSLATDQPSGRLPEKILASGFSCGGNLEERGAGKFSSRPAKERRRRLRKPSQRGALCALSGRGGREAGRLLLCLVDAAANLRPSEASAGTQKPPQTSSQRVMGFPAQVNVSACF